ncbi:MAG: hypothetical protein CMI09_03820 [Oceanospirillaceae bacterium]|nr:hypothetical protein [Oceanospirillaceae bacterium]|tara:strand:- start:4867 stop:5667 length:801 start_codon:yes stop_codon:yes gene_type:complete
MICVYEASNALEAHMIIDLLANEGINAHISGEYLQGGIGEIQTQGFVEVKVAESDSARARELVLAWDAKHVEETEVESVSQPYKANIWAVFLLGLAVGGGGMYAVLSYPSVEYGVDFNGDGISDEKFVYRGYILDRYEMDRNFDRQIDSQLFYDRRGLVKRYREDDDFDSVFEHSGRLRHGVLTQREVDLNGDGISNLRGYYQYGVCKREDIFRPGSKHPVSVFHYESGVMKQAEYDLDEDGIMDITMTFDQFYVPSINGVPLKPQ